MLTKKTTIWFVALILLALSSTRVYAYINFNTIGPDSWANPGYVWDVYSDTESGESVCIQWSADDGSTWDRSRCTPQGGTSWQCNIPNNIIEKTVRFEFYKDSWDDNCAVTGNENEWTGQYTFNTGPLAVSLQSFTGESDNARTWLLVTAVVLLFGSTLFIWQRKRQ